MIANVWLPGDEIAPEMAAYKATKHQPMEDCFKYISNKWYTSKALLWSTEVSYWHGNNNWVKFLLSQFLPHRIMTALSSMQNIRDMTYTCVTRRACYHNQRLSHGSTCLKSFKPLLWGMHIRINFIYATVVIIACAGMRQLLVGKCGQHAVWEKVPSKLPCLENVSWGTAMWFSGTKYDSYT